jgi:hypothetical protein
MDDQDNVTLDGSMETVRYLQAKIRELRAENKRLLKVVETAELIVVMADVTPLERNWAAERLRAALAEADSAREG